MEPDHNVHSGNSSNISNWLFSSSRYLFHIDKYLIFTIKYLKRLFYLKSSTTQITHQISQTGCFPPLGIYFVSYQCSEYLIFTNKYLKSLFSSSRYLSHKKRLIKTQLSHRYIKHIICTISQNHINISNISLDISYD